MAEMPPPPDMLALRRKLGQQIRSGDSGGASGTLIKLVFQEDDRQWLEDKCLELLQHPDINLQEIAITAFGHIARIHGRLNRPIAEEALVAFAAMRPELAGHIDDTLSDFEIFLQ